MGYRLDIELKSAYDNFKKGRGFDDTKPIMMFGKMYGYGCDVINTKSGQYLKQLGLIDGSEYWGDGFYPDFELTPEQLKIFAPLYIEDFIEFWKGTWKEGEIEEYRKEKYKTLDELLKYNENVILNWG